MSMWVYNFEPEGSCFGPASDVMVAKWDKRTGPYILYTYHGYTQKVVLRYRD